MAITRAALFVDSWSMDPAELDFAEFRNRHIWGPPDSSGSRQCINVAFSRKPFPYSVEQRINPYLKRKMLTMEHRKKSPRGRPVRISRCPSFRVSRTYLINRV